MPAVAGGLGAALLLGFLFARRKKQRSGGEGKGSSLTMPILPTSGPASDADGGEPSIGGYSPPTASGGGSGAAGKAVEFSLAQIEEATDNFSARCKLDEGAFGAVYRGKMRPSGRLVAIKVLKPEAATAVVPEKAKEYAGAGGFRKELKVLSKYRHQNIVGLLGFCLTSDTDDGAAAPAAKQCLVFEFMAGGSLKKRLGDKAALAPQQRFDIASDVARGLEFLHVSADPPIIHQDIKSDNILLAEIGGRLVAKVADFGTARYAPQLLVEGQTHHSTGIVVGTKPYMPPEYSMGRVSEKTDAYAFGVVLLELLTGRPPFDYSQGVQLAMKLLAPLSDAEGNLPSLLDKRLGRKGAWPLPRAIALGRIARRCIDPVAADRCTVAAVLPGLDALAGRIAVRRAGRGEEYDPMTGELRKTA